MWWRVPETTPRTPLGEAFEGNGVMVNSGEFDGLDVVEAKRSIVNVLAEQQLAETRVNFRLHDWCISRAALLGPSDPDHPL